MNRVLVTVDVEALPARARRDHVQRLIWGEHPRGRAGIAEICDLVEEFGGVALFFLEVAGSLYDLASYREINSYLTRRGHLVEWHYHPEILGKSFWRQCGATGSTLRQDLFDADDANLILKWGLEQFVKVAGRMPCAYRAGSFRWNRQTLAFLSENDIGFSFNACAETALRDNYATFKPDSPRPFYWENGVIEVPCGEHVVGTEVVHFRFPRPFPKDCGPRELARAIASRSGGPVQILLHSWSLLDRDEHGYFYYRNSDRIKAFRRLLERLTKEFSIPPTPDLFISNLHSLLQDDEQVPLPTVSSVVSSESNVHVK